MEYIGLASDHAGYLLKCSIKKHLLLNGFKVKDFGCDSDISCDYPDYAHLLGIAIDNKEILRGIVFCGSGNGINMAINKHQSVRSAICWNLEVALLARNHNNANVCSLPARFLDEGEAINIVDIFLNGTFDGGRHSIRINKIPI